MLDDCDPGGWYVCKSAAHAAYVQVKVREGPPEAEEPRELFDFRGNKQVDFPDAAKVSSSQTLTWRALKAVGHLSRAALHAQFTAG